MQWVGFTRKDSAKKAVVKYLKEGEHFTTEVSGEILLRQLAEQDSDHWGGHNKETVLMTVHGFKQLCMAAKRSFAGSFAASNTEAARRVRDYYQPFPAFRAAKA